MKKYMLKWLFFSGVAWNPPPIRAFVMEPLPRSATTRRIEIVPTLTTYQHRHRRQPDAPSSTKLYHALSPISGLCKTFEQQAQALLSWLATTVSTFPLFANASSSSFVLTRIVFLRALGFVYFVAFLVAFRQNKALIGDNGITPAKWVLEEAKARASLKRKRREAWLEDMMEQVNQNKRNSTQQRQSSRRRKSLVAEIRLRIRRNKQYQRIREVLWDRADRTGRPLTTVLWLARDFGRINPWLDAIALAGTLLSVFMFFRGAANVPILLLLWICQRSLMALGQNWYGYGWEVQLAELGFHSLFLVPLLSLNPISQTPVPGIVMWTIRWHLFRVMLGAGLIKFRSRDKKWNDFTAMYHFYETQPVPSVFTKTMHFMPKAWHRCEVMVNHVVECVAPFLLIIPFLPRAALQFAGLIQMLFQATLIGTGNLSFLNWLTMVPAILCLDDSFLGRFFSPSRVAEASLAAATFTPTASRRIVSAVFGGLVMWLSVPVIKNLLSKQQQMNASFDPLRLINTYGAFGVVDEEREEWIIQSATDLNGDDSNGSNWREYEFKAKPGNVYRRPKWITPYHYRLDWQMWIASSCRALERSPWIYRFLLKLLEKDKPVQQLLEHDPWVDEVIQPKYIRICSYRYRFHKGSDSGNKKTPYWDREFIRQVYPRQGNFATIESLIDDIKSIEPARPL